jgi:uncharacterized linocin/CFP29 family protein
MADLNWSDAQWQRVNDCVTEAFGKANVATSFLPCYGPLSGSTETVRNERLRQRKPEEQQRKPEEHTAPIVSLEADHDAVNLRLVNLTVKAELTSEQVADETLSNALLVFRRAANILAQESDVIVFEGYERGGPNSVYVANQIQPQKGLADLPARFDFEPVASPGDGGSIVRAVVTAIQQLEDRFHPGPFACVLGREFFDKVHTPTDAMVLPADRITPLLKGGPLLRSGKMHGNTGIVVSLAGNAIDMVVGTPPSVQFLQRTPEARYLFRAYTRFVLRIRDEDCIPVAGFTDVDDATRLEQAERLKEFADLAALAAVVKARLRRE